MTAHVFVTTDDRCRDATLYTEEYDEAGRLTRTPHGRLEAARTRELLAGALPRPPARILDVGGGPGRHAQWMAGEGYDVTLIDVVEAHVRAAQASGLDAAVGECPLARPTGRDCGCGTPARPALSPR